MSSNLQLKSLGLEDYFLTNNTGKSFLAPSFTQHQNFSRQVTEVRSNKIPDFAPEDQRNSLIFNIPKEGHFLHRLHLYVKTPPLTITSGTYANWTNGFIYTLVDSVELEIGGVKCDAKTSILMDIEDELKISAGQRDGYNTMVGKNSASSLTQSETSSREFVLPLTFWFNKNISNSLPVALMKYQDIKIIFNFKSFIDCVTFDGDTPPLTVNLTDCYLIAEYFNVEKETMKNFVAQSLTEEGLNYLVEQTCVLKTESINAGLVDYKVDLTFNGPVKEIYWVIVEKESEINSDWFNYSRRIDAGPPMLKAKLIIDGIGQSIDYFSEFYFRFVEPQKHHSNIPQKYINLYSFSLKPEEINPTGSLNFSAVSLATLNFQLNSNNGASNLYVFGSSYNVFTVTGGVGYLKF